MFKTQKARKIKKSATIISFTMIEFLNEELIKNTREILAAEIKSITGKLKARGMIKFQSSGLFLPENRFM